MSQNLTILTSSIFVITIGIMAYFNPFSSNHSTCNHSTTQIHNSNHTHSNGGFCGFDAIQANIPAQDQQLQNQLEQQLYDLIQRGYPSTNGRALYTLPVVVHVVHNNGSGNIPNSQAIAAIQHLNDAFANVGVYNPNTGVDVDVQFCLAQRDPMGNTTTGITNTVSTLTNLNHNTQDLALKNLIRWNPLDYINIWVVNNIQGGVAGYAYFPSSHGNNLDGIVLEAGYMGTNANNSKVLVHEMGHYLGLYHTFQGGCANNDCLTDGDRVCDTPPDNTTAWVPCAAAINSCSTDDDDLSTNNPYRPVANGGLGDQLDQKENYMDYSDFVCYDRFTQGQKIRTHFFITGIRASLLTSLACSPPCPTPINVGFTASATTVTAGTTVNFNNTTTAATTYEWFVNGTSFATTTNSNFTFNTIGSFNVVLEASNGDPNCTIRDSVTITVTCNAQAAFVANTSQISPGDVVLFNNSSTGATSYQWFVNNVLQSTATNFNFTFPTVGTYDVFLVATDGVCNDTSATLIITVTTTALAQTGLPIWPLAPYGNVSPSYIDWRDTIPVSGTIPTGATTNGGQTGAAFNECGQLAFYTLHTGSGNANNLFIYAADGSPLLTNATPNGPGLNAVKAGQEIQVIKVPQTNNEWYIIYKQWTTDAGAPGNNGAYTPANWLYSRVQYNGGNTINILQRDIALTDGAGVSHTYTDGAAVSRTAAGLFNQHYLYLCRRTLNVSNLSLDRFLITNTGITWSANTGTVNVQWWGLTIAGSPIELSPTEDKIAVNCRNQSSNFTDIVLFDANLFNAASAQNISLGNLILQPDGTPNDQSNVLNISGAVDIIATNATYPLRFLSNMERKVGNIEFSPNGRFLYFTTGGYAGGGLTNLTYLGQIDLNQTPFEVRLQIQTVPSGLNMISGTGCSFSNCLTSWNAVNGIESCYDGNLYYSKRNMSTLFVIPNPNSFMPQNLVPSNIDISTPTEPNINFPAGFVFGLPDQIDGFNYLASQYKEVELIVQKLDCNGDCDSIAYPLSIIDSSGAVIESFLVDKCPDTLTFCADTSLVYSLQDTSGNNYPYAVYLGQTLYPAGDTLFDFSENTGCNEICDNGIDDDGDGLIDCYDPDCCGDTSCTSAYYQACLGNACTDSLPSGTFSIQQAWQSTINVANWGQSLSGDIDNDGATEIVSFRSDGSGYAVNGQTGALEYTYNNNNATQSNGYPAIANLDSDPEAEIVISQNGNLKVYEHDGTLKWSVATTIDQGDNTIGIYDFNSDGIPEIVYGRRIYSSINGLLLASGTGARGKNRDYNFGGLILGADVIDASDCSGNPNCDGLELVAGPDVYSVNIVSYTNTALNTMIVEKTMAGYGDGYTSVADFDKNGTLDIIVSGFNTTTNQRGVYVWNPKTQTLIRPFWGYTNAARPIGRPNIADFDGDGALEIAVEAARFGGGRLHVLDNNMTILWSTNNNDVSGATGCTAFDFNNDGQKEIVYRDQTNLYIINGLNGAQISSINCSSGTVGEYPIVADVDNDGQAEIVCHCGGTGSVVNVARIHVFESNSTPWMPARNVWNQHAYSYTNINDDLSVPRTQQNHHIVGDSCVLNNFLNQHTNIEFVVPDATISVDSVLCDQDSVILVANICNIGSNVLPYLTPITIYNANPSTTPGAIPIAPIYTIGQSIEKDSCLTLNLKASNVGTNFYIVVNDDASIPPVYNFSTNFPVTTIPECNFLNNIDSITFISTPPFLNLGPDTILCENSVLQLNAGSGFNNYLWQNGSIDSTITADSSGLYWVEAIGVCGDTLRDSITISIDTIGLIALNDTSLCQSDTLSLSFNNTYNYQWFPNQSISCNNCATPSFHPTTTTSYTVVTNNSIGCFSVDSFTITVDTCHLSTSIDTTICLGSFFSYQGNNLPSGTRDTFNYTTISGLDSFVYINVQAFDTFNIVIDTTICLGSNLTFAGQTLLPNTSTLFNLQTLNGCDSIIMVNILGVDTFNIVIDTSTCLGNTVLYNGQSLVPGSSTTFNFQTTSGCDSIVTINVSPLDTFYNIIDTIICAGDSIIYNGQSLLAGTSTIFNFQTFNGCDSTIIVNVNLLDTFNIIIDTAICAGNTIVYNGQLLTPGSSTVFNFQTFNGCDSIITVNVNLLDTFNITIDTAICAGNTIFYNGQSLLAGTSTIFNFQTVDGCDSIVTINVNPLDTFNITIDTAICVGTNILYNGLTLQAGSTTIFNLQTINGCDSIITVNVNSFPISFTISNTDATCFGASNGSATINVSGGVGGFVYAWNGNSQTTATATGLPAGSHCVTVTDLNGCTVDTCITVGQPTNFSNINFNTINVSCFGGSNGSATMSLTGGTQPYTYVWSAGGQTGPTATGLNATTHSVTVTDNNGCTVTANVVITEPTALQLAFDADSVRCKNGNDGQLEALVTGGTFPYTYQWDAAAGLQNTAIATGLTVGNYSVVVTDFNGCTISGNNSVAEPQTVLTAAIINQSNPLCHNACDGMIEVDAQGATPNYTYQWNNGQNTSIASGVCAGVHTVTVTDANGCSTTAGSVLTDPPAITLNPQVLSNYNGAAISCPGETDGIVGVTVAGGSGGFSYVWSPTGQNTATINNLVEGTYCVTVSDVSGCESDTCITITDPVPLAATFTKVDILCKGDANGQILVNATTGTGTLGVNGYEYKITGPGQTGNVYSPVNNWNNLAGGSYVVYLRDGNNCELLVPIAITEPDSVLIDSVVINDALCNGTATGTALAHASGGVGGYTYLWSNNQTQNPATGLAAGLYSVTVSDANGCDRVQVFNVGEPTALTATIAANPIPCFGGNTTATVTGSGGTPLGLGSYVYNWSNGNTNSTTIGLTAGVHCVTVTDANACTYVACVTITQPSTALSATTNTTAANCNGTATGTATATGNGGTAPYNYVWLTSPNQSTQTATGLAAGTYTVEVRDTNDCLFTTTVTVSEPTPVVATITGTTNSACSGIGSGTATVAGSGGTAGYSYQWDAAAGNQTGATATGLGGGSYNVTVSDANGCTAVATATVISPAAVDITSVTTTAVSCNGGNDGTAFLTIQGGTPAYSYQWSNAPGQNSQIVSGLTAGLQTVVAIDANGCTDTASFTIGEPSQGLTGYLTAADALCYGAASGELGAVVQGGTGAFTYAWNSSPVQTTVIADSLAAGTYVVTISDANGCTLELTGTIGEPSELLVTATVTQDVTCAGGNNGAALVNSTTGGTPGYTYVWTDPTGQVGASATNLSAGVISVIATDANTCTASSTVTITEGAAIALTENVNHISCHGLSDGSINITGSNSLISTYTWSNSTVGIPNSGLSAGVYDLTVTDVVGCNANFSYTITEPSALSLGLTQVGSILCHGAGNASALVSPAGGSPGYSIQWSSGANTALATNLAPATHTVTITDANGCSADSSLVITEPEALVITGSTTGTLCAGDQTGILTAIGSGGTVISGLLEYSIDGSTWQNGNIFSGLTAGIYTLSVKDENGCISDTMLTVDDADPFFISSMTPNQTIEYLDSLTIEVVLNDTMGVTFNWTQILGADTVTTYDTYSFGITPAEAAQYQFTATNANGCALDSIVIIEVDKPRRANAPTGFTPNGDGVNDYFFIQGGEKVEEVTIFRVYDRWGELVFEGNNSQINIPEQGWDGVFRGQPASSGVYTWYADVLFKDGGTKQIKGNINLLR